MMRRQTGFSLIEMLVVVAIIGIIAATGVPHYLTVQRKAREAVAINNMRALTSAENTYIVLVGGFASYALMDDLITRQYIDSSFNQIRSGYSFSITQPTGVSGYQSKAQPQSSALKYYFSSETGLLLENTMDDLATATPLSGR